MKANTSKHKSFLKRAFLADNENSLNFEYKGITKFLPLLISGGFFALTVLLFAFGPFNWHINNEIEIYSFLTLCIIALIVGYTLGVIFGKSKKSKIRINISDTLIVCSIVYLIMYLPTVYTRTGKVLPDIITGLLNAGKAYQTSYALSLTGTKLVEYIRILLSPFMIMIMPVTLFFMPKLTKISRIIGFTVIIFSLLLGISQGINKIAVDITIQLALYLTLMLFTVKGNDKRVKVLLQIFLVFALFFAYYSSTMRSRVKANNDNPENMTSEELDNSILTHATFGAATLKSNYYLVSIIPSKLRPTALFLVTYVTHGYKGLSIAMNQNFTSTYGLGFSDFYRHNYLKIFNSTEDEKAIYQRTYMAKTSVEDWETGAVWSTFFVYPASDISFFGTILLVLIIGFLFALSWKDAVTTQNIFAITVFFNLCIMIFYFSANNQLFQSGEAFVGFLSIFILWLISRKFSVD